MKQTVAWLAVLFLLVNCVAISVTAEGRKFSRTETPYVRKFDVPVPGGDPIGITVDAQNRIWFGLMNASMIGVFTPGTGEYRFYRIPERSPGKEIYTLAFDDDGFLWFTDWSSNAIWRLDPNSGVFRSYPVPIPSAFPTSLALRRDGTLAKSKDGGVWFSLLMVNKIGRIDTSQPVTEPVNAVTLYDVPTPNAGPAGLFMDDEGFIWVSYAFVGVVPGKVARFDPQTKTFKEFSSEEGFYSPVGIMGDTAGNLWIADHGASRILKLDPKSGRTVAYDTSDPRPEIGYSTSLPFWIRVDGKGNIWFNEHTGDKISRFIPEKQVLIEYHIYSEYGADVLTMALDHEGKAWFTELSGDQLGYVDPTIPLPFSLETKQDEITVEPGKPITIQFEIRRQLEARPVNFSSNLKEEARFTVNPLRTETDTVLTLDRLPMATAPGARFTIAVHGDDQQIIYSRYVTLIVGQSSSSRGKELSSYDMMEVLVGVLMASAVAAITVYLVSARRRT